MNFKRSLRVWFLAAALAVTISVNAQLAPVNDNFASRTHLDGSKVDFSGSAYNGSF
jgi:hypothetical protein